MIQHIFMVVRKMRSCTMEHTFNHRFSLWWGEYKFRQFLLLLTMYRGLSSILCYTLVFLLSGNNGFNNVFFRTADSLYSLMLLLL